MQFFGGRTVARWASVWSSGVDLVARYTEARLDGTLPDMQHAAQLRQVSLVTELEQLFKEAELVQPEPHEHATTQGSASTRCFAIH